MIGMGAGSRRPAGSRSRSPFTTNDCHCVAGEFLCQSVPLAMRNSNRRSGTERSMVSGVGWARQQSRCLNRFGSRAMFTALANKGRQAMRLATVIACTLWVTMVGIMPGFAEKHLVAPGLDVRLALGEVPDAVMASRRRGRSRSSTVRAAGGRSRSSMRLRAVRQAPRHL